MGALAASRAGGRVVSFLGHAEPPAALRREALGIAFRSPVGVGADLPRGHALAALHARMGAGFVEVGPVSLWALQDRGPTQRRPREGALRVPRRPEVVGVEEALRRLARHRDLAAPLGVRLAHAPGADARAATHERVGLVARLAPHVAFFTLAPRGHTGAEAWTDHEWREHVAAVRRAADGAGRPLLVGVEADAKPEELDRLAAPVLAHRGGGVLVVGGELAGDGGRLLGASSQAACLAAVRHLRARWGRDAVIVAAGSAVEPADALALLDAGATLVQLDAGLVLSGPGLPKRVHEALRHREDDGRADAPAARAPARTAWLGMALLGLGMMVSGALAWAVAVTSVVLPYDEAFVGMAGDDLAALNDRLLPFLTHDRVTLAGTMVSIGILYAGLALFAQRRGARWARHALTVSAAVGFASFFLFLGFGYFDPLHALVCLLLLPFFLWGARGGADGPPPVPAPDLRNDRAWRLAQWGQLGFVVLGAGLVLAGLDIARIGSTRIFVSSDLEFLGTTSGALHAANDRLLALVAHDRAGFGGALVADGLAVLLAAIWGVRRGARWLWWTFLLAGVVGFGAAIGVHVAVGYLDAWHLAPALLALAIFLASLEALRPFMLRRPA